MIHERRAARPRPRTRPSLAADIACGALLVLAVAGLWFYGTIGIGRHPDGQYDQTQVDRAEMAVTLDMLIATLVLAVPAAWLRSRVTTALQLLCALALAAVMAAHYHEIHRFDPPPRPAPDYRACYSGSDNCP
ncbi:DUF6234 family protein [Kitasatospora sp. RB6PN24]|uniref:DUF6234 family protein n=1 Tax=Kitasatospora humi TaxID=2893891 RepID=UPI001E2E5691|nr:DUF6234 family protein [Kitasatospora humi]MCC9306193.1 DUF6234 family protein [Kitasatospora humi]